MKRCLLFCCAMLVFLGTRAQYDAPQNRVWAFGDSAAVSFASGSPVVASSNINAAEGCASVCDAAGNLLFYTEGTNIYNATHTMMPHGANVCAPYITGSTTQAATIVPIPGVGGKYYVFSLGLPGGPSDGNCRLVYSIVDMSLDGGMGDVSTVGTALNVGDSLSEKMTTVRGDDCNVWLIVHRRSVPHMLVYEITPAGISAPATYTFGGYVQQMAFHVGVLKASPDGHKLVSQSQRIGTTGRTELFDFNPATGVVSNRQIVDSGSMYDPYGAEFSADNSKLYSFLSMYTSATTFSRIWQYDLSLPTPGDISASRTTVTTYAGINRRDLRLGPDDKIYVNNPGEGFLDCIPNPNMTGAGCGYMANAVSLGPVGKSYSGLPNTVQVAPIDYDTTTEDIHQCRPDVGYITLTPASSGSSYLWYDGSTAATHNVTTTGNYWVHIYNGCDLMIDTFRVVLDTAGAVFIGNDTTINAGDVIVLTAHPAGGAYVWSNGEAGDTIHVGTAGTYWVMTTTEDCVGRDTIVISVTAGVTEAVRGAGSNISPNPAKDVVTVNADGLYGKEARISIVDISGRRVLGESVAVRNGAATARMDIGELATGVYMIQVESDAGYRVVRKLVVE